MLARAVDTIVAPITGQPPSAVAVVRLSGPMSWEIAAKIFSPWPKSPESHRAYYGRFTTGDDGLALLFADGRSYTGDQTVELSIHGSSASIRALIAACLGSGARMAEPGEFTQRAFLNGRLDLTQAEAVADTIDSETEHQLRLANLNRDGALRNHLSSIGDQVLTLLATAEATVDFSEEIGELDHEAFSITASQLAEELRQVAEIGRSASIHRQGVRIAIVGPPNAGKSSLFNRILGRDRAIVTDIAGTTRDVLEEVAVFDGNRVVLIDTAGLRDSSDIVEAIGIQRSRAEAAAADEVWYVYDAALGLQPHDREAISTFDRPVRIVANKSDLAPFAEGVRVSAITGAGIGELIQLSSERLASIEAPFTVNERQHPAIIQAAASLADASERALALDPPDLLIVLLREAISALGEVTGETASVDILDAIFSKFCLGK